MPLYPRIVINPKLLHAVKRSRRRLSTLALDAGYPSVQKLSSQLHDLVIPASSTNCDRLRALAVLMEWDPREPLFVEKRPADTFDLK